MARSDHVHDWRVDPRRVLTSIPPRHVLVCAECGATTTRAVADDQMTYSRDPKDWPMSEPGRTPLSSDYAKRIDAMLKDVYISETMLDSYYKQRERHRELMLKTLEAAEHHPDDLVVQFMQATAGDQADIIDRTIESLEQGLANRPEGGWLADLDRKRQRRQRAATRPR